MTLDQLLQFIKEESCRLQERYYKNDDPQKVLLARTVKLTEEVGELSEAVLGSMRKQRDDKFRKDISHEELESEIADVLICTLLVAEFSNCDVKKGLQRKIDKILKRYE